MIQIKNLTVKNFMSVGAATQAINFDRKDITLIKRFLKWKSTAMA